MLRPAACGSAEAAWPVHGAGPAAAPRASAPPPPWGSGSHRPRPSRWLLAASGAGAGLWAAPARKRPRGTRLVPLHGPGRPSGRVLAGAGGPAGDAAPAEGDAKADVCELEERLRRAVEVEDFEEAARLQHTIQMQSLEGEVAVLGVNSAFFEAYQARDLDAMSRLWHEADQSCCIHAGSRPVHGFEAVMGSWEALFKKRAGGRGSCVEQSISVRGNLGRAVRCERLSDGTGAVVTNHFELTPKGWKVSCHQISPISEAKQKGSLARLVDGISDWIGSRWRRRRRAEQVQTQQEPVFMPQLSDVPVR